MMTVMMSLSLATIMTMKTHRRQQWWDDDGRQESREELRCVNQP
jgi:hypothetical protein